MNFNFEVIDLDLLVDEVVEKMSKITTNHQLIYKKSSEIFVVADKQRIEQVLTNLITNAARYSNQGKNIEISLVKIKNQAQISIRDYGIGIPKDKLTSIFERFYQVNNGSATGFGRGLYIAKEIVIAHKGKIWVESEVGKGSIFHFALPIPLSV